MPRIARTDNDLISALKSHVSLLQEYHDRAFNQNDSRFFGEVAAKIRLLIYRSRTCHPLLLDAMEKYGITVNLTLMGPRNREANIQDYFHSPCGGFRSERTGNWIEIKPIDVVRNWAQQIGASHEDPSIDDDFME